MKMHRIFLIVCACLPLVAAAQNFNPHSSDSTSNKEVPQGLYVWTVDRHFGDIRRAEPDTLPHLYPQSTLGMGRYGEYNTVGSNYTARQNRIFTDRKETSSFLFTDAYDQSLRRPDEWHFTNTLSPITNLGYDNCGDKTNGEDHINAFFAVNAGKQTGLGFNLDYQYARGYFQNQNVSHFGATVYVSHLGDRYQVHALYTNNHQKAAENGGIVNDDYITHPELFTESYSENEIPTVLDRNWNRNNSQHFFLTHRYSLGFYRKVSMTEEEKKARVFAIQSQKEKAARNSSEQSEKKGLARRDLGELKPEIGQGRDGVPEALPDSLMAQTDMPTDSIDQWMKNEYVPVTSFIHTLEANIYDRIYQAYKTPKGLYADTLYDVCANGKYSGDSIYDQTKMLQLRNTVAIALLEGFNKYAPAGLKAFASYEVRRYDMPDLLPSTLDSQPSTLNRWTEHYVSLGGQLQKTQGRTLHYNLLAETWVAGEDVGALRLDATADLNFPLFGDTVTLAAKGWLHRMKPTFYQRHYHSKHLWWDNDFSRETRTHIEGSLTLPRTKTSLRVSTRYSTTSISVWTIPVTVRNVLPSPLTSISTRAISACSLHRSNNPCVSGPFIGIISSPISHRRIKTCCLSQR